MSTLPVAQRSHTDRPRRRMSRSRQWAFVPISAAGAVLAGALTSFGQAGAAFLSTLSNSAGPWFLVAVALILLVRPKLAWAMLLGVVLLELMHVGYWAATVLRGYSESLSITNPWILLGVPAGIVAGLVVTWAVSGHDVRRAAAFGITAAILAGEGIRSLIVVGSTTSNALWITEIIVGVVALVVAVVTAKTSAAKLTGVAVGVAGTAAVLGAYMMLDFL